MTAVRAAIMDSRNDCECLFTGGCSDFDFAPTDPLLVLPPRFEREGGHRPAGADWRRDAFA